MLLGLSRSDARERLEEVIEFSGLDADTIDAPLAGYSAGMGLRLGFSLVVATHPDVLLVDEVLAVGDDAFQRRCLERIDAMRDDGCAVVFVSHDMAMIASHTDAVAVLERGELAMVGAPADAVAYHLDRRAVADTAPAGDRSLFGATPREQESRRRRGAR